MRDGVSSCLEYGCGCDCGCDCGCGKVDVTGERQLVCLSSQTGSETERCLA